ncbi:TonB-dependent receptor [Aequoribacter fuscus]|uniref:TonB-dependent receptor n=1 Tax=Aequoribacter fuscus TaxID=2518989 RepID=F3L3F8_9GAMM|nr:TonB-dependent receptor [Aequoribacter fuscus]EGG29150.1 TonB-dependent receptor [Aequoribacter fuscus]QHJ86862.1 TonB-dependent receptor [Aequoribacter fuscus]
MKLINTSVKALSIAVLTASQVSFADTGAMEEIIVTAQKRDQSVLDVAATMDVISAEFLERTNTTELDDLSRVLPNVVIQEQAVSLPSFNIRGITDDTASVSATPRISVYQDGFDISKKTVSSAALYDIARVEVLKGPQPTLFGVAAANGAVSIITNTPDSEFDADARFALNTEAGVETQAMINLPVNDHNAFRIAGIYREMDGVIKNTACSANSYNPSGQITDHTGAVKSCQGGDLNGVSVQALRATFKTTYDNWDFVLRAGYEYNDQPGIAFKSGSIAPKNGDSSPFTSAELGFGSELGIERELMTGDFTLNYRFSETLSAVVDGYYKDVELNEAFDADGTGLRIQDAYFDNDAILYGASARLVFDDGERFAGFVGISNSQDQSKLPYYVMVDPYVRGTFDAVKAALEAANPDIPLNQNISTNASLAQIEALRATLVSSLFNADGTVISDPNLPSSFVQGPYTFEAELDINSIVAEGSYQLTDKINATAGVRYIDETRLTRNFVVFEAEKDFTATLPRLALNYAYSDDLSFYFNYAQGRRSPVVDPNFGATVITKAETVDSYDVGFKYMGDRWSLFAALFTYQYQDYQQSYTDATTLQSITVTVGDSTMSGFEATARFIPSDTLMISASLGLLDATFASKTADGQVFDYAGNNFRLAPEVSGSLNINKRVDWSDWTLDMDLLMSYQSEVFFESSNYPGLSQDAYWITDASVMLNRKGSSIKYELYADNLFDEEYLIDAGNTGGGIGIPTYVPGMPMIAGVRVYVDF